MTDAVIAPDLADRSRLFIDGQWRDTEGGKIIDVLNPVDQSVVGQSAVGTSADIDRAVGAAKASFEDRRWRDLPGSERAAVMRRAADILESRLDEIAVLLTSELGCPLWFSQQAHVPNPIRHTRYYADLAESYELDDVRTDASGLRSIVTQEPVGVAAAITPWNGPLSTPSIKIAPAIAAGCSVVLKPPTQTPLSAFAFADAFAEAGLPEGVLNIVPADREAAQSLIEHPQVDKLAFTGSTAVGQMLMRAAANRVARVTLELGGKSAAVVLPDADAEVVAKAVLPMALVVNGQLCIAQSRILVPRNREAEFTEAFAEALREWTVGHPMDPATKIGPLVSKNQLDTVQGYISLARDEGARIVAGAETLVLPPELENGWFVPPTLLAGVDNSMRAVREEIFGPVLALVPYDEVEEAIDIANDSPYGLSGSVWGADVDDAIRVARRIRTGMVSINGSPQAYGSPFGGYKMSGIGREMGPEGFRSYLETKSIAIGPA
ncbi:aldehyde dehydrogenase [Aeromicrobium sp. YIM 150415]|uniref:aldehyde dehydrogenase n=1 Tax=Aeromicrobium sp. YIM 150415 TaxID=2803912 RepID=UPI0019647E2B|nr:aldehyde dehydrogenase [Aeromicrobium sp. YIM 150415]MBM9465575.1 aldehyde dehydrogenase [Aeromicrobium sp. YIM 150415]